MKPLNSDSDILQLAQNVSGFDVVDVYVDQGVIDTSSKNFNDVEDEDIVVIYEVETEVEAEVEGEVEAEVQVEAEGEVDVQAKMEVQVEAEGEADVQTKVELMFRLRRMMMITMIIVKFQIVTLKKIGIGQNPWTRRHLH